MPVEMVRKLWLAILAFGFLVMPNRGNAHAEILTCHYDEVLTIDVLTSYAPDYAVRDFKNLIRRKYSKNIEVHVRKVLKPEDFFDRVRAGKTDVISPSHNFLKDERAQFIKNKMIIPLEEKDLPNLQKVDPRFTQSSFVTMNGKLYGLPLAFGGYSLLYKKDAFQEAPNDWNILWEEKYKGRYSISKDFYEANIYVTLLALGYSFKQMDDIEAIDTDKFYRKLKYLLENANYWEGAPTDEDVKRSVLTTAWGISHSVYPDEKEEWIMAFPDEGVTMWGDYLSVTKNVERSPLARTLAMEWLNYMISPEFQKRRITKEKRYLTPLTLNEKSLADMSDSATKEIRYLSKHAHFWPILTVRTRNRLKYVYDQVLKEIKTQPAPAQ